MLKKAIYLTLFLFLIIGGAGCGREELNNMNSSNNINVGNNSNSTENGGVSNVNSNNDLVGVNKLDYEDWQEYKDVENGFEFKYPKEWEINECGMIVFENKESDPNIYCSSPYNSLDGDPIVFFSYDKNYVAKMKNYKIPKVLKPEGYFYQGTINSKSQSFDFSLELLSDKRQGGDGEYFFYGYDKVFKAYTLINNKDKFGLAYSYIYDQQKREISIDKEKIYPILFQIISSFRLTK